MKILKILLLLPPEEFCLKKKKNGILEVWHEADDGMWQFLDGNEIHEGDAVIVSLKEIVTIDSSVNLLSNLPLGGYAWRNTISEKWNFD